MGCWWFRLVRGRTRSATIHKANVINSYITLLVFSTKGVKLNLSREMINVCYFIFFLWSRKEDEKKRRPRYANKKTKDKLFRSSWRKWRTVHTLQWYNVRRVILLLSYSHQSLLHFFGKLFECDQNLPLRTHFLIKSHIVGRKTKFCNGVFPFEQVPCSKLRLNIKA